MMKMMKKIKNKTGLQAAKLQLRVKELEMEKVLNNDWKELKEKLNPKTVLGKAITEMGNEDKKHWLVNSLAHGAAFLTKNLLQKAGAKIKFKI